MRWQCGWASFSPPIPPSLPRPRQARRGRGGDVCCASSATGVPQNEASRNASVTAMHCCRLGQDETWQFMWRCRALSQVPKSPQVLSCRQASTQVHPGAPRSVLFVALLVDCSARFSLHRLPKSPSTFGAAFLPCGPGNFLLRPPKLQKLVHFSEQPPSSIRNHGRHRAWSDRCGYRAAPPGGRVQALRQGAGKRCERPDGSLYQGGAEAGEPPTWCPGSSYCRTLRGWPPHGRVRRLVGSYCQGKAPEEGV
jgi:hypothetical protein